MSCPSRLIGAKVVALEILGVSLATFHNLRKSGEFPLQPVRIGRSVRWSCEEVDAYIAAGAPSADRWEALRTSVQESSSR